MSTKTTLTKDDCINIFEPVRKKCPEIKKFKETINSYHPKVQLVRGKNLRAVWKHTLKHYLAQWEMMNRYNAGKKLNIKELNIWN